MWFRWLQQQLAVRQTRDADWIAIEWIPPDKTTLVAVLSLGSCDGAVAVFVDFAHYGRFLSPVVGRVLNDAEGIDPEVLDAELARDKDGILKRAWESGYVDAGNEMRKRLLLEERNISDPSPTVAKTTIY